MSNLPSSMQAKRAELEAGKDTPPAAVDTPPANDPPKDDGDRVTISKAEFNELQAKADRVKAAEAKAQAVKDDLEAFQTRLTELENASKGNPKPADRPAAPASNSGLKVEDTEVALTQKEIDDFDEDMIVLVNKIANNVFTKRIKAILPQLEAALGEVHTNVEKASQDVIAVRARGFTDKVKEGVAEFSDFDTIVNHKHWPEFVQAEEEASGLTYGELVQKHLNAEDLKRMVGVFKTFFDKYMKGNEKPDGYQGVDTTDTTAPSTRGSGEGQRLKFSERQAAHRKYINKEISFEEYQQIKDKFDKADAAGLVDYDN